MPLIIRYPNAKAGQNDQLITNADFAPTILAMAGLEAPADMQGESFYPALEGEQMEGWRKAVYYHYFEYPAVHSVKRHYGIRTDRYKLIHYYYDIDAWELYDLENDPTEMNNLAEAPEYADLLKELKAELQELRATYQDTDTEKYLPQSAAAVDHIAIGKDYDLKHPPAKRYPGTSLCLTDGLAYPEGEVYAMDYKGWMGLQGDDLWVDIDLGDVVKINEIRVGFLQDQLRWIFLPEEIDFYTSVDGMEYMKIHSSVCDSTRRDQSVIKKYVKADYPGLTTRHIRIHAMNRSLPEWHTAAGKPGWLFTDEIIIN